MKRDEFETSILLPDDVPELRRLVLAREARLVVIDPLMAHLASQINSWKDQTIREALTPLHWLAEETGASVVVVAHLNKGQGANPLQRLGGSIGLPAAARSVLLLARDPADPEGEQGNHRVLAHVKSNHGELAPSLAFAIEPTLVAFDIVGDAPTAVIREVGPSPYSPSELLSIEPSGRRSKREAAVALLKEKLTSGPQPVKELHMAAAELGISVSTLERAGKELGVKPEKMAFGEGWSWRLPEPKGSEEGGG